MESDIQCPMNRVFNPPMLSNCATNLVSITAETIAILVDFQIYGTVIPKDYFLVIRMKNFLLEQQKKEERLAILTEFIQSNPEARELKRAMAVKMALQGRLYSKITKFLGMHKSCITTWKQKFEAKGLEGIKLAYHGRLSYLTPEQKAETITWLHQKEYWDSDELVTYLDEKYGIIYKSKQSYYELLSAAGISWKKSQKVNPRFDPELVKTKREEIINFVSHNQAEIQAGQLIVFFLDECHLLGNDVCGYVWGQTNSRIEIPIKNIKDRQTPAWSIKLSNARVYCP